MLGVFSTRSADRPNPIGLHSVEILAVHGPTRLVRNLEAIGGPPVLDVKPLLERRRFAHPAEVLPRVNAGPKLDESVERPDSDSPRMKVAPAQVLAGLGCADPCSTFRLGSRGRR